MALFFTPLPVSCATQTLNTLAAILIESFPEQYGTEIYKQIQQDISNPKTNTGKIAQAVAMSDFVTECLKKQPHFLRQWWQNTPVLTDCEQYAERLAELLAQTENEERLYQVLRQFRNREMAVLSFCQSLNLGTVEEIFIRLSRLAEALIIGTRDWLYRRACAEMGIPMDGKGEAQQLYILGMGKLGGFELNFSSDIDLIFTYPAQGETVGVRRHVDNAKFFTRLGQRLINALDQLTPDGFVYRVDMRLRPFGDGGALALSFGAMESYYQEQGRDWERYAMIKGRILGADPQDPNVRVLQQLLRPFVYRRYIDFSVIRSLREMKDKIAREVRRRGLTDNIKLGAGGIREIEFIVQVFQLMRGGREVSLQRHELLKLLPEIEKSGLIDAEQRKDLQQAYLFLRRVENVLQAIDDKQTQLLPMDEANRRRLAYGCTRFTQWNAVRQPVEIYYPIQDWEDFYGVLWEHRQKVRSVFDQLIGDGNDGGESEVENDWADFLDMDADHSEFARLLMENGIDDEGADTLSEILIRFKTEVTRRPIGTRGREVLKQLMPTLLHQIFSQKTYRTLLPRMLNIVEKILTRTTYLELLLENPQALTRLTELCAQSYMIAEQVASHPILLDELLDQKTLSNPPSFNQYPAELKQYLLRLPQDDEEQFIDALRQFKQTILLRVAAADILGALPVMKVSDHLTFLAEAIIQEVVNLAWRQVGERFGTPDYLQPGQKGFLIIGYGKLGGIELGYKSDLDIVFLFDDSQQGQTVGGKKTIDSNRFYLRLAQKIVSIFSLNTSAGILYDVDMRLRPSGEAGLLVSSLAAFEAYQLHEAWTWERQALVRGRAVFGEQALRSRFDEIRGRALAMPRDMLALKEDVCAMREKMYIHLANTDSRKFNLKTDRGGITDIEFIAQYLVLANAPANPALTYWSDNVRIFDLMAEYKVITLNTAERLKDCYTELRNRIHHLNLLGLPPIVNAEEFKAEREFIGVIWRQLLK